MVYFVYELYVTCSLLETMEEWDQETLEKVVESRRKEYNMNKPTDIVSLHPDCL